MEKTIPKPKIFYRWCLVWLLWVISALLLKVLNPEISRSVLLGGCVAMIPSLCFAWLTFRYQGARQSQRALSTFYRAEGIKFIFTAGLFSLVFIRAETINIMVFFVSFILAQILFCLVAWRSIS